MRKIEPIMLSNEAKRIVNQQYGFRDDTLFGDGVTDFESVLKHEVKVLGNRDILDKMPWIYGFWWRFSEDNEEAIKIAVKLIKDILESEKLYCKWICDSLERVREQYNGENVLCYGLNENYMIFSDLGIDGILVVSDKEFKVMELDQMIA